MSGEPQIWMWTEACESLARAERLHRRFFALGPGNTHPPVWEPPVDIFETERELWVLIALPGVDPELIEIEMRCGLLIVAGVRCLPAELNRAAIHRLEIPHGRFERRIELPAGCCELAGRVAAHGCVLIGVSKRE